MGIANYCAYYFMERGKIISTGGTFMQARLNFWNFELLLASSIVGGL